MSTVILTGNNRTITLDGSQDYRGPGIALTSIQGWYETPNPKVNTTSRNDGDGGHDINPQDILYEARVITLGYRILAGPDRALALSLLADIDRLVHGLVDCRVIDHGRDAYCAGGYYARSLDQKAQNPAWQNITGSITLVFERPEILSTAQHRYQLYALARSMAGGGLTYGGKAVTKGLSYPLDYGLDAKAARGLSNVCMLKNDGSSRAYPIFTVNGPMPSGVQLVFAGTGLTLACDQPVYDAPLVLDTRTRSASIGGRDVSRRLTSRGWPTIPAGGSLNVALTSQGSGWVNCLSRDTYM